MSKLGALVRALRVSKHSKNWAVQYAQSARGEQSPIGDLFVHLSRSNLNDVKQAVNAGDISQIAASLGMTEFQLRRLGENASGAIQSDSEHD
jgi:hypothetical protein